MNFEQIEKGKPVKWYIPDLSAYTVSLDSIEVKSGKYSIAIEFKGDTANFQPVMLLLPENYDGKKITLSGYIKTENVTEGYAGMWMRIDPGIAFDNMSQNGVTGTTDWTRYEITLDMNPAKSKQIVAGGLLVGKGKMWLDDLSITIDGQDIKAAQPYTLPAGKDKEFDSGSNIVFPALNKQAIDNLELLGKLWGFLKYHHPEVGKGNYNWDYELFRMLPDYLSTSNNNHKRDQNLLVWIRKYGEIPACETCKKTSENAFLKPDLSWVDKSNMNAELKETIKNIYANRHQGEHFYIKMAAGVGNPQFSNENSYSNMPYPDAGFRLLALYRYWNMIQYFYPNKHLTDKSWDKVLKEYILQFISAKNELEYELATLQMIGDINDTHATLREGNNKIIELRGNNVAPFRVQFVENKLVVTDYYNPELQEEAGLKVGDIITHINKKAIDKIVDSLKIYYPASNQATRLRNISEDLLRSNNNVISIKYLSSGQVRQKELILHEQNSLNYYSRYRKDNEKCFKMLDGNIGYITLKSIKDEDVPNIKNEFKNTKGIIIDIRNYPSIFVPFSLGSWFVSSTTPFAKFTGGNTDNPGEFTFRNGTDINMADETYTGKLVVIVNEITQSSAEYTAMAFRAGANTTVTGSTTAGADGNVSPIALPGGILTVISGIGVYYPDGRETQRIGIVPDIEVKPTIQGIKDGRDEVLEKAIEIIEQGKN
ncbi:hypothetical protein AGMMS50239_06500 [Bacteroidia bacterium]|nr:hypothetical protein AGMMS50239_06500 [Bacteroidia bacterium]